MNSLLFVTRDIRNGGEAVFIKKLVCKIGEKNRYNIKIFSLLGSPNPNDTVLYGGSQIIFNEIIPSFSLLRKFIAEVRNNDKVIIFPFGWQSIFFYMVLLFRRNVRVFSAYHTNIIGRVNVLYIYSFLSKLLTANVVSFMSERTIFITNAQKNSYKNFCLNRRNFEKNAVIIPNFIDDTTGLIRQKKKSTPILKVLFVGRLKKSKGFDDLLKLISNTDILNCCEFLIVGEGQLKNKIPSHTNIRYLGHVPHHDMDKIYASADVLLLPSYAEVFPMVILEAMRHGVVVLVSDLPGMNEIVSDEVSGIIFKRGDVGDIYLSLKSLIDSEEKLSKMSNTAKTHVEKFGTKPTVDAYINVLS